MQRPSTRPTGEPVAVWVEGMIEQFTTYTNIDEARAAAERLAESRE